MSDLIPIVFVCNRLRNSCINEIHALMTNAFIKATGLGVLPLCFHTVIEYHFSKVSSLEKVL